MSHREDRVRIVERYDVLYARLRNEDFVCKGNAFICSHDSQLLTSTSARAVTSEILSAICSPHFSKAAADPFKYVNKFVVQAFHAGTSPNTSSDSFSAIFHAFNGLRRRVPDRHTLDYLMLYFQETSVLEKITSRLGINDIPIDLVEIAYPTRKDGTMTMTAAQYVHSPGSETSPIYVLENGTKRRIVFDDVLMPKHSAFVLSAIGVDEHKVFKLSKFDMSIIPEGSPIQNITSLTSILGVAAVQDLEDVQKVIKISQQANRTYGKAIPCILDSTLLQVTQKVFWGLSYSLSVDRFNHY